MNESFNEPADKSGRKETKEMGEYVTYLRSSENLTFRFSGLFSNTYGPRSPIHKHSNVWIYIYLFKEITAI